MMRISGFAEVCASQSARRCDFPGAYLLHFRPSTTVLEVLLDMRCLERMIAPDRIVLEGSRVKVIALWSRAWRRMLSAVARRVVWPWRLVSQLRVVW